MTVDILLPEDGNEEVLDQTAALARTMMVLRVNRAEAIEILCDAALSGKLCPVDERTGERVRMPADVEAMRKEMKGDA